MTPAQESMLLDRFGKGKPTILLTNDSWRVTRVRELSELLVSRGHAVHVNWSRSDVTGNGTFLRIMTTAGNPDAARGIKAVIEVDDGVQQLSPHWKAIVDWSRVREEAPA